jgi:hypothetical protein
MRAEHMKHNSASAPLGHGFIGVFGLVRLEDGMDIPWDFSSANESYACNHEHASCISDLVNII